MIVLNLDLAPRLLPPVEPILTSNLKVNLCPEGILVFLYRTVTGAKEMLVLTYGAIGLPKRPERNWIQCRALSEGCVYFSQGVNWWHLIRDWV